MPWALLALEPRRKPSTRRWSRRRRRRPPRPWSPADRKYLLERVDDAAVAQLYADGFASLPLKEKTLIWHLYQAAIAGRDIFYDQKHRDALEMRDILEQIVAHPQGIDAATLAEIQRYTKLFWINNGPYNNLTARKFVLKTTPQAFAAAAGRPRPRTARRSRPARAKRSTPTLARLQPMFFDADGRSDRHQQDARAGQGHPAGERQQSVLRRQHGRSEGLHREERPELAAREA